MGIWKAWFDIRQRFLLSFVLVTLMMVPGTVATAVEAARVRAALETAEAAEIGPQDQGMASLYDTHVGDWLRGQATSVFSILAIVLAVGGILSVANAQSNLVTLSLPAGRQRWMGAQAAVAAALVLVLCAWEGGILVVTGWTFGLPIPLEQVGAGVLLTTLAAIIWIWPAILATALTRDAVRAALITVSVMVALQTTLGLTGQTDFMFRHIGDVTQWSGGVPWAALLLGAALAAVAALLSMERFRAMEF